MCYHNFVTFLDNLIFSLVCSMLNKWGLLCRDRGSVAKTNKKGDVTAMKEWLFICYGWLQQYIIKTAHSFYYFFNKVLYYQLNWVTWISWAANCITVIIRSWSGVLCKAKTQLATWSILFHSSPWSWQKGTNSTDEPVMCLHIKDHLAKNKF